MPEAPSLTAEHHRITLSRETAELLKQRYPSASYEDAIKWLLKRDSIAQGDLAACTQTELWIKLDRVEEMCGLLSLTNMDLADHYRRVMAGEVGVVASMSETLAATVSAHQAKENRP